MAVAICNRRPCFAQDVLCDWSCCGQGDAGLTLFKLAKFEENDGPHLAQYTGTVCGASWGLV
jgi:hypothetical protein